MILNIKIYFKFVTLQMFKIFSYFLNLDIYINIIINLITLRKSYELKYSIKLINNYNYIDYANFKL